MQNYIKTETRLAFIQFIFSSLFSNSSVEENINDFENYFYKLSVPSIKKKKEILINFNKNYFKKLTKSYEEFIQYHNIEDIINSLIKFDRKFKNWDQINKSIILSIFSELEITKKEKVKILVNDYINISKTLIPKKDLGMINAITDKYLSDKNIL
jgi:transcription termination factor NusB